MIFCKVITIHFGGCSNSYDLFMVFQDLEQTDIFKHLLQNLCILEHNGERWFDLHPLIRNYMEKKKWK
jgi:hypothetical protein